VDFPVVCLDDLHAYETDVYVPQLLTLQEYESWHIVFFFDLRRSVKTNALFNLGLSGFILCLLVIGSLLSTSDANYLVLDPAQHMIKRVP